MSIRNWVLIPVTLLIGVLGGMFFFHTAAKATPPPLEVYAGYMDTHSNPVPSTANPSPWPYTDPSSFIGSPCPAWPTSSAYNKCWDAASLRLVNTSTTPLTGVSVTVVIGTRSYNRWGTFTITAGGQMVLTETGSQNSGNMDLSDQPPNSYNGGNTASCVDSAAIPEINVTIGGVTTQYTDSGQVLNTGGVDGRHCKNGVFVSSGINESHPWTQVFSTPTPTPTPPTTPPPTTPAPSPSCTSA